ncbi:MAG: hypothetical protein R3B70_28975 [Polyangiaceae bacterium]
MDTQHMTHEQRDQAETIQQIIKQRASAKSAPATDYVPTTAVTASASVGPDGANAQGYITYLPGVVVEFELLQSRERRGIFAGGAALAVPLSPPALSPERLRGKTGNISVFGWGPAGTMIMTVDGVNVLAIDLLLAGVGLFGWRFEGTVRFR